MGGGFSKQIAVMLALVLACAVARADQISDLVKQLGDQEDDKRAEAAETLARIGGERVEKIFREMVANSNPERRQMAVVGLLQVSDADKDVQLVRGRLKDESSTVRWSAVLALSQAGITEAVPDLEGIAKNDESESVREAATEAATKLRSSIGWLRSLPDALKKAKELNKPVLVFFYMRGSAVCQRFEEGVLAVAAVVDASQEFVCVRLDTATKASDAQRLDVRGAPTILIVDAQGNEMSRLVGLVEPARLLEQLAEARRGKLTFREAKRLAMRSPEDVQANWKVAQTYLEDGREDLADPHLRNVIAHDDENRYGYTNKAMFALGFCLGKRGEYAKSVYCLEKLLERWPNFKDKDKALYCLGLSDLAIGQKEKGRAALEQLVREFPESSTVKSAKEALEKLGTNEKNL